MDGTTQYQKTIYNFYDYEEPWQVPANIQPGTYNIYMKYENSTQDQVVIEYFKITIGDCNNT